MMCFSNCVFPVAITSVFFKNVGAPVCLSALPVSLSVSVSVTVSLTVLLSLP